MGESTTTSAESISHSKHLVVWSISNFSEHKDKYKYFYSVDFPLCKSDCIWKLIIEQNWEYDNEKYLRCAIKLKSNDAIQVHYDVAILDKEGKNTNSITKVHKFVPNNNFKGSIKMVQTEFNKFKDELWSNDTLTIVCNIRLAEEKIEIKSKVIEDLRSLMKSDCFSDLTINIGQQRPIRAHRSILAARTKYFKKLLSKDTISIRIDNTGVDIFRIILKYIYTGVVDVDDLKKSTKRIFIAADKYKLDDLKLICETELSESMSIEFAADILILAHNASALNLKATASNFIRTHFTNVSITKSWDNVIKNHAKLCSEVLSQLRLKFKAP